MKPKNWFSELGFHILAMIVFYGVLIPVVKAVWQLAEWWSLIVFAIPAIQFGLIVAFVRRERRRNVQGRNILEKELSEIKDRLADLYRIDPSTGLPAAMDMSQFVARTAQHHSFVHAARDLLVKMLPQLTTVRDRTTFIIPDSYHADLRKILDHMAAMFKMLSPEGVKVFAAIRERRGSRSKPDYKTILRSGDCDNFAREAGTRMLNYSTKMVQSLKDSFSKKNDCVLLTGIGCDDWEQDLPNNARGEDKSVLLGAVFSKNWSQSKERYVPETLEWIVSIAADREGVFTENHKSLMKCFNDVFSILVNVTVRKL